MKKIKNKKVKKVTRNKKIERDMNIELDKMTTPILKKFKADDMLMALMLALSSKQILSKDVDKAIRRLLNSEQSRRSAEKSMRGAFKMAEKFLTFITVSYIQKEKNKSTLSYTEQ